MPEIFKKRLFIAINLPQNIKDVLANLLDNLRYKYRQVKWVRPEGLHLTLHFLGYLDEKQEKEIKQALLSLSDRFKEFKFRIGGEIGAFPNLSRARVIFINCDQINGKTVYQLQNSIGQKLIGLGLETDKRVWKSHITLGRVKEGKIGLDISPNLLENISKQTFAVSTFELMESVLNISGAEYKEVESYKL